MPITLTSTKYTYARYAGNWTLSQVSDAVAGNKWPIPPILGLWTWGQNNLGQSGLNNTTLYSSPIQITSGITWSAIALRYQSFNGIKNDGTLWSWGMNNTGQLGLNNTTLYSSPKQVGALTNWSKIVNFYNGGAVAIKSDGTLWMWGSNTYGQLGLGNTTPYSSPKQVGALTTWAYADCGYTGTAAVKTDGTLWTWGYNTYGSLGLGNITQYSSPKQVGALTNWAKVSVAQGYHVLAIKTDGTLWSWGYNLNGGPLGLGNMTYYSSPKQVGALTNWATSSTGSSSSFAIKTDGSLWSWGQNAYGELGLGNTTNYSSPKQVGALTNWSKVSGSPSHTASIKTDTTLWIWGQNAYGGLGLGNTTRYSSPKQVGSATGWSNVTVGMYATAASGFLDISPP